MLSLPPSVRIFIATQSVDGRKGFDSLAAMIRSVFDHDPLSGHLYVFFSRRCDRVRVVYWDRDGFAMWSKRLERGRYHPRAAASNLAPNTGLCLWAISCRPLDSSKCSRRSKIPASNERD